MHGPLLKTQHFKFASWRKAGKQKQIFRIPIAIRISFSLKFKFYLDLAYFYPVHESIHVQIYWLIWGFNVLCVHILLKKNSEAPLTFLSTTAKKLIATEPFRINVEP